MAVLGKAVGKTLADRDFVEVVRPILADLGIDFGPKVERPAIGSN